jgi:hypothetical protein
LSLRGLLVINLIVLDSAFLVPVEAFKAPFREPALFLLEVSVLRVKLSKLYKIARFITFFSDLALANASISICVRRLSEGLILREWVSNKVGELGTSIK